MTLYEARMLCSPSADGLALRVRARARRQRKCSLGRANALAERVVDCADAAEDRYQTPEERPEDDVLPHRLRVRQEVDPPCDQDRAHDDTRVPEHKEGDAPGPVPQVDERRSNQGRYDTAQASVPHENEDTERGQSETKDSAYRVLWHR